MTARAASAFRRTQIERSDQHVAWKRPDQAFFAAGACHILAWACRDAYPSQRIEVMAMRFTDEDRPFHAYARWRGWAFDHAGWNLELDLVQANADFESRSIQPVETGGDLAAFCEQNNYRKPSDYWKTPIHRAKRYVAAYAPPWSVSNWPLPAR